MHLVFIGNPIVANRVYMLIQKKALVGKLLHTGHQRPVLTNRRLLRVVADNMSLCWICILLNKKHDEL